MRKLFLSAVALVAFSTMTFAGTTVEKMEQAVVAISETPCADRFEEDLDLLLDAGVDNDRAVEEADKRFYKCLEDTYG